MNAEVWTVNPPGFGCSAGPTGFAHYAVSAEVALNAARARLDCPLWVAGKSIGTLAALHVAARWPVEGLILRNVTPLHQLLARQSASWAKVLPKYLSRKVPKTLDAFANAALATAPALFIISKNDVISPAVLQHEVADAYLGPCTRLEVAGGHDERQFRANDEALYRAKLSDLFVSNTGSGNILG